MMRIVIAVLAVVACGLVADGLLGVATAETPTTPTAAVIAPPRTVSVQGVATAPLASEAPGATATAVYRQAMAAAVADGQSKAQFLAEKAGATLGPVQTLAEGGGSIECPGDVEYTGGQPDFGFATGVGVIRAESVPRVSHRPVAGKPVAKHRPSKRKSAKQSTAATCTLSTQVALAYQLG
jgi:hypothetical protein